MTTGKTIALTRWPFVSKVMSLLFIMLSSFVIAFLPRRKHLLISWLQAPSAVILEPKKIKSLTVSTVYSSICHEWWDWMSWSQLLSPLFFHSALAWALASRKTFLEGSHQSQRERNKEIHTESVVSNSSDRTQFTQFGSMTGYSWPPMLSFKPSFGEWIHLKTMNLSRPV